MDATLCDTVGTQIVHNKRHKVSALPAPLAKIAAKPQFPQPTTTIRPNGDFAPTGGADSAGHGATGSQVISSAPVIGSMTTATNAPELKPLIVLNSDVVATSIHSATIVPSPSFISSPCFTGTGSTPPSLGPKGNADLNASRYAGRKAPSFSPGAVPFRLGRAPLSNSHNIHGLSSSPSFPPTSSSLTSSTSTSLSATSLSGSEGQNRKGDATSSQEVLKQQEEQAYLDRVARRRVEAREKRRERREVRMAESLGRIATALELLSSKQDTVIALLQRLAERK